MLDQFAGTVFTLPTGGNTQGLNVNNFMKVMGANNSVTFTPEEPLSDLQTGVDATGAYFSALERANQFGMEMAAKGIDVLRPNNRNPQSIAAARQMQTLMRDVHMQSNGLKVGQQMAKEFATQRLKPNVATTGPLVNEGQGEFSDATTASDLNRLVNMQPVIQETQKAAKQIDDHAKSYDTEAQRDYVNLTIDDGRAGFDQLAQKWIDAGYPEDQVQAIIENAKNSIGKASYDPLEQDKLGIKKSELQLKQSRTAVQNEKTKAETKNLKKGEESASELLDRIVALNEGRDGAFKLAKEGDFSPSDDLFRDWEFGKGSQGKDNEKRVVRGVVWKDGRASAVITDKSKIKSKNDPMSGGSTLDEIMDQKETELRPLDIDFVRDLYTQNGKEDEFDDFMQAARNEGLIDSNGNLKFKKNSGKKKKGFSIYN